MSEKTVTACKCCGVDLCRDDVRDFASAISARGWVISSGYRCPSHNASPSVGGVSGSQHVAGLAVDVLKSKDVRNNVALMVAICAASPSVLIPYPWGFHVDWR